MEEAKVPELRFPEFDEEWVIHRVEELLIGSRLGGNYSNNSAKNDNPLIKMGNLNRGKVIVEKLDYIDEDEELNEEDKIKSGDLFFNTRNTLDLVGKVAIWRDELESAYYNSNLLRIDFENNYFMNYRFNTYTTVKNLRRLATGTTSVAAIYNRDLFKLKLTITSQDKEQKKIASFLSAVDTKIELLTRKKELLEEYKKGVMQKLFTYELRLGKSDLRKGELRDFGYFYYGKGAPKPSIQPHGKTPCVRYGELYSTYGDEIKEVKSKTIVPPDELKLSKGGEVLVPRVGEDPKDFANCSFLPFKNVAIGEMISVYNTEEDGLFMTYYINSTKAKDLAIRVEGGNVSNLYYKYVEEIEVKVPSIDEQKLIVKFIKAIDSKIESIDIQIERTQNFKKGLLQQMFV